MLDWQALSNIHLVATGLLLLGVMESWREAPASSTRSQAALGLAAIALALEAVLRSVLTGRAPVVGAYENTLVVATFTAIAAVLVLRLAPPTVAVRLNRLVAPWAIVALAYGWAFGPVPPPLGAEGRGLIGYAHAFIGWADFVVLLVASMSALGMLIHRKDDDHAWRWLLTRLLGAGFVLLTATMATGSWLTYAIFGIWYQWQIVEVLAAVLWLVCGLILHARLLFGWQGKRLAVSSVVILPITLAAFWSWSLYAGTYHFFERVLGQ